MRGLCKERRHRKNSTHFCLSLSLLTWEVWHSENVYSLKTYEIYTLTVRDGGTERKIEKKTRWQQQHA